jgi:hypothetical protein
MTLEPLDPKTLRTSEFALWMLQLLAHLNRHIGDTRYDELRDEWSAIWAEVPEWTSIEIHEAEVLALRVASLEPS